MGGWGRWCFKVRKMHCVNHLSHLIGVDAAQRCSPQWVLNNAYWRRFDVCCFICVTGECTTKRSKIWSSRCWFTVPRWRNARTGSASEGWGSIAPQKYVCDVTSMVVVLERLQGKFDHFSTFHPGSLSSCLHVHLQPPHLLMLRILINDESFQSF